MIPADDQGNLNLKVGSTHLVQFRETSEVFHMKVLKKIGVFDLCNCLLISIAHPSGKHTQKIFMERDLIYIGERNE